MVSEIFHTTNKKQVVSTAVENEVMAALPPLYRFAWQALFLRGLVSPAAGGGGLKAPATNSKKGEVSRKDDRRTSRNI